MIELSNRERNIYECVVSRMLNPKGQEDTFRNFFFDLVKLKSTNISEMNLYLRIILPEYIELQSNGYVLKLESEVTEELKNEIIVKLVTVMGFSKTAVIAYSHDGSGAIEEMKVQDIILQMYKTKTYQMLQQKLDLDMSSKMIHAFQDVMSDYGDMTVKEVIRK